MGSNERGHVPAYPGPSDHCGYCGRKCLVGEVCPARVDDRSTHADNMADMTSKGRAARGDANGARKYPERRPKGTAHKCAKLAASEVVSIRELYTVGFTQHELAAMYRISRPSVGRIVNGRQWAALGKEQG